MSRRMRRSTAAAVLLFAAITWTGCADDEDLTGPGSRGAPATTPLADELTCVVVSTEPVMVEACDLGATLSISDSYANDVNDAGQVALWIELEGDLGDQAHVWSEATGVQPISDIEDWITTEPLGINEEGIVVGRVVPKNSSTRGFRWNTMTGEVIVLDPPVGWESGAAQAVSDNGQIVGWGSFNFAFQAISWYDGSVIALPIPATGWEESGAEDINEQGAVAGYVGDGFNPQPASWCCGSELELTLLGSLDGDDGGYATGINDATPRQIVGVSYGSTIRAYLWEDVDDGVGQPGTMVALPDLGGDDASALDINDRGYAVGNSRTSDGQYRAVAWTPDSNIIDLGMPNGYTDSYAWAINENGLVVGYGEKTVLIDGEEERVYSAILWKITLEVTPPPPPTPEELLQQLRQKIQALVDAGSMTRGQGRSLLVKVWLAERWLERGRTRKVVGALKTLNWHIWVFTKVRILTFEEARPLWELTSAIIELLKEDKG